MPAVNLPLLISILALLLGVFSFFYLRSYLKRRTSRDWILSEVQEEVNNILGSLDETTERDISLVEERERNLKALLEEVEKRLKVYIREIDARREAETNYAALSKKPPNPTGPNTGTYEDLGKNRYNPNRQDNSHAKSPPEPSGNLSPPAEESAGETPPDQYPAFPLPRFRVKPDLAPVPAAAEPPPKDSPSINMQIRELVQAGIPAQAIASRLGVSIAEVEFAAALLERRGAP